MSFGISKLLELLEEPLSMGLTVDLCHNGNGEYRVDLLTYMKSECILEINTKGNVEAHCRYGKVKVVEDYDHLLRIVAGCGHGREYCNGKWFDILEANGMEMT